VFALFHLVRETGATSAGTEDTDWTGVGDKITTGAVLNSETAKKIIGV